MPASLNYLERLEDRRVLAANLNLIELTTPNAVVIPGAEFSGDFTIRNDGNAATSPFRVEFRLSRNTTYADSDDILLGFTHVSGALGPGEQTTLSPEFDLPRNVFTGNYYLGAFADSLAQIAEGNEADNIRFTSIAHVIVATPDGQVDIDLDVIDVDATPGTYNAGSALPGTATYRNTGTFPSGAFTTTWFLSTNDIYGDADDVELFVATSPGGLGATEQLIDTFTLAIPINAPAGDYSLGVFVDSFFDINEPGEEYDNISFSPAATLTLIPAPTIPDLVPVDVDTPEASYQPGESLSLTSEFRNAGDATTGAFAIRYVLTLDTTVGNADDVVLVAGAAASSLGPGEQTNDARTVEIPTATEAGLYYLALVLDPDDAIAEADEGNNTLPTDAPVVGVGVPELGIFRAGGGGDPFVHDDTPRADSGARFGGVEINGGAVTRRFVIRNLGGSDLIITNIITRNNQRTEFSITPPTTSTLAPGESTSFMVTFDPAAWYTRRTKVVVQSNDPLRDGEFFVRVKGRGLPDAELADIGVTGGTRDIADGTRRAKLGTGTNLGESPVNQELVRIFTITNLGTAQDLQITSVSITGGDASDFSVGPPPTLIVGPRESTTLTLRAEPSQTGRRRATVRILTNDPDEPEFDFKIKIVGI